MAQACLEWPQRGAKNRKDMMIILLLFCASCAFLWRLITLAAGSPRWVSVVDFYAIENRQAIVISPVFPFGIGEHLPAPRLRDFSG
jgi:hypothetical protein